MAELHEKYAPILRFNEKEQFYPLRVDDLLAYSSLHMHGQPDPIVPLGQVTPAHLAQHGRSANVYLRSVEKGPLLGPEVVSEWGEGALELLVRWSASQQIGLTEQLARQAYRWFGPKTRAAAQLFWWNDLLAPILGGAVQSARPAELPRLILPQQTRDNAIERYNDSQKNGRAYTYYYRQVKDGNFLCLQYWFFYSYNDWGRGFAGFNDHEGDWEGMMLFFELDTLGRPQEPPAYVTFADHDSRQTKAWGHPDVTILGTHPVGYPGAGSHATYPDASVHSLMQLYNLFDYANGDGITIDHDDWVHRINLDETSWLASYKGSWGTRYWLPLAKAKSMLSLMLAATAYRGLAQLKTPSEIELPGVSAPFGPVSPLRPQYATPASWAGVPPPP